MNIPPRVTIIARTPESLARAQLSMIDEAERLAYFAQSARSSGGRAAKYVPPEGSAPPGARREGITPVEFLRKTV